MKSHKEHAKSIRDIQHNSAVNCHGMKFSGKFTSPTLRAIVVYPIKTPFRAARENIRARVHAHGGIFIQRENNRTMLEAFCLQQKARVG